MKRRRNAITVAQDRAAFYVMVFCGVLAALIGLK